MNARAVAALGALVGCQYHPPRSEHVDANPEAFCVGPTGNFRICLPSPPTAPVTFDAEKILDTDSDDCNFVFVSDVPELCVVVGTTLTISTRLGATGTRPLVLLASDNFVASGVIDVASHRGSNIGPNANATDCTTSTGGTGDMEGGGGGAGGSFGSPGGTGGEGKNVVGGVAGAAIAEVPAFLRGGCRGGDGGHGGAGALGGGGGDGGGAVYILSGGEIKISGGINASGAGATASSRPTANNGGGAGGGGSGGMIALYAETTLEINGRLLANGGGGAEGGDKPNKCDPGDDPVFGANDGGLRGSGTCGAGGDGGDGAGTDIAFPGTQGGEGGGGGGGGLGVIRVLSGQPITGSSSPAPSS